MGQLSSEELELLAEKWLNGNITPAEEVLFNEWYEQTPDPVLTMESRDGSAEVFKARLLGRIRAAGGFPPGSLIPMTRRIWPARLTVAATVLLLATGTWLWVNQNHQAANIPVPNRPASGHSILSGVVPGHSGAILTLTGGRKVMLDSTVNGLVTTEGRSTLFNSSGQLTYKTVYEKPAGGPSNAPANTTAALSNTLTTDRGNQYQLVLPDGTRVWLNAASSVTYPTVFTGHERTVTMTGEAYFEVVHRDDMPFKVKVANREIDDLGTHFNVNAYEDGSLLKTTLLEGSVRIGQMVLSPGEQASIDEKGRVHVLKDADMDQAIAWKNGLFQFDHADLKSVMAQLSRWYAIDVRFEGNAESRQFGGKISRYSGIEEVLKVLELSNVHFRIENKTIVVLP